METGNWIWCGEGEEKEAGKKGFAEIQKHMESDLSGKPFFGGNGFGFLDVALITFSLWFQRCLEIENVSISLADLDNVYNYYLTLKKKRGL